MTVRTGVSDRVVREPGDGHSDTSALTIPRQPWITLVIGYLCITGTFGLAHSLVYLDLAGLFQCDGDVPCDWQNPLFWGAVGYQITAVFAPGVMLAAGLLVWRNASLVKRVVVLCSIVLFVQAATFVSVRISWKVDFGFLSPYWILDDLSRIAIPAFALWFIGSNHKMRHPEWTIVGGSMLLWAGFRCAAYFAAVISSGEWFYTMYPTSGAGWIGFLRDGVLYWARGSAFGFICALCGIGILLRPQMVKGISVILLCMIAGHFVVDTLLYALQMATGLAPGNSIEGQCLKITPVVLATYFAVFVHNSRNLGEVIELYCRRCGYDLTGNVSGVCPECGTVIGVGGNKLA